MKFEPPLQPATLIRRYKRFLADIILDDGSEVTAHCANPGAMAGLTGEGQQIWIQPATNPSRKLKYSWILVDHGAGNLSGIDTSLPNKIIGEALRRRQIPAFAPYATITPEQKYGENSRIDFLLTDPDLPCAYVEVKNVHFNRHPRLAEFPDSVTARGTKHLGELANMAKQGHRAAMLYLVQRTDCDRFKLACDIDPKYAAEFNRARAAGMEAMVFDCEISADGISLGKELSFTE